MKEHAIDRRTRVLSMSLLVATLLSGGVVAALAYGGNAFGAGAALGVLTVCALSLHRTVVRQLQRASMERRARLVQQAPPRPSTGGWGRVGRAV